MNHWRNASLHVLICHRCIKEAVSPTDTFSFFLRLLSSSLRFLRGFPFPKYQFSKTLSTFFSALLRLPVVSTNLFRGAPIHVSIFPSSIISASGGDAKHGYYYGTERKGGREKRTFCVTHVCTNRSRTGRRDARKARGVNNLTRGPASGHCPNNNWCFSLESKTQKLYDQSTTADWIQKTGNDITGLYLQIGGISWGASK